MRDLATTNAICGLLRHRKHVQEFVYLDGADDDAVLRRIIRDFCIEIQLAFDDSVPNADTYNPDWDALVEIVKVMGDG